MKLVHWTKLPDVVVNNSQSSLWRMRSQIEQNLVVDKTQIVEWFKISQTKVIPDNKGNPNKATSVSWLLYVRDNNN